MERLLIYIFTILCLVSTSIGKKGFGPGEQEWGYVEIRPNAKMFWWLFYTTADLNKSYYDKPLIIWLQGGPGRSSSGYGNFLELGPLDMDLKPRNYTWVENYNVLFIDNPVGSGFSYANDSSAFATTNAQIASDLLKCIQVFYNELPQFRPVPTYIATQSYGGKMGAEFALVWYRAQKQGTIESNLKGISLGSSWISPIDTVMNWAPFLLNTGIVDIGGYAEVNNAAQKTKKFVDAGDWKQATKFCGFTQAVISLASYGIDVYNILDKTNYSMENRNIFFYDEDIILHRYFMPNMKKLEELMNGPVKEALDLQIGHGNQSEEVFELLKPEFMKPAVDLVEKLLNETDLNVFIYGGQLDLLVDIAGMTVWVDNLNWKSSDIWKQGMIREPLVVDDILEGYYKRQDNFAIYWVLRAGHMVPKDNPAAMKTILENLTSPPKV
ncbi:retinoid-inducible serine carboxypeptidase-like [Nylanderia fulva]|uniref:retinoid-inducible serine carboxypeptidase-like n=1 Tax=Nylanderia fulva TaxID=613905 RepID=UPI0010FB4E3B|nr:retinoid-inducible serine carboxypeptidase-like [Nylanderia fulva]